MIMLFFGTIFFTCNQKFLFFFTLIKFKKNIIFYSMIFFQNYIHDTRTLGIWKIIWSLLLVFGF